MNDISQTNREVIDTLSMISRAASLPCSASWKTPWAPLVIPKRSCPIRPMAVPLANPYNAPLFMPGP